MSDKPEYQFRFQIIDKTSGDVIGEDWTYLTDIDQFGGCESVDIHVASTLRWFKRTGRAEHEAANYAPAELQSDHSDADEHGTLSRAMQGV